eukprot:Em0035g21a
MTHSQDEVQVYEFQESGYLFNEKPQSEVLDCESDSESDITDVELETAVDNEEDSQIPHSASFFSFPRKMFARLYFHLHSPRPMMLEWKYQLPSLHQVKKFKLPDSFLQYDEIFHGRKWNTDSRRASQLLNHLGGSAKKFCRFCMADRDATPQLISEERMEKSLQKIRDIQSQLTAKSSSEKSTEVSTKVPLESVRVDTQDLSSVTLSQLLTMNPPFEILLDFGEVHHQTVVQYRAVVSHKHELIHSGEYVQLHTPINEFKYGQLPTTLMLTSSGASVCLVQGFEAMALADGTPLLNKFDCPLFSLSRTILSVDSTNILAAVLFVHECDEDVERNMQITQEREEIDMPKLVFEHNWSKVLFCYSIYCIQ